VEGYAHGSFGNAVASTDLDDLLPKESTTLPTARNARDLLDLCVPKADPGLTVQPIELGRIFWFSRNRLVGSYFRLSIDSL